MHHRDRTKGRRSQSKRKLITSRWSGPIEALEVRRLLDDSPSTTLYPISALYSTPVSSTGWAQLPTQTNGWIVYVSSSEGDDGNSGHDPDHPVATLAKAKTLMRDGHDDEMLLLRGDVWDEPIGSWSKSGPTLPGGGFDTAHPQVISYYSPDPNNTQAGDRPLIDSGTNDGITFVGHASDVAIIGLQFSPNSINNASYDGTNSTGVAGMRFQLKGSDYLVEDCLVDGYKDNIVVGNPGSPVTDFVLHRSESLDSYNATGAHSQGLYVSGGVLNGSDPCDRILIQENTFDHNGWNDNVSGADKTFFNHNMYINTGATNVQVLENTITRGALRGTLLRAGGIVENNFYDQNAVGIQVDNTGSTVDNNVILEGDDLPSLPSGVGIDVSFDIPSVDIENNIVAHDISDYTYNVSGIDLESGTQSADVLNNIVYDWRRPLIDGVVGNNKTVANGNDLEEFDPHHPVIDESGSGGSYSNNTYYDPSVSNAFESGSDRVSYTQWKADTSDTSGFIGQDGVKAPYYPDPNRSMATYAASIGLSDQSFDGWVTQQRQQSRANWNTNFTALAENQYIRDGFVPNASLATLPSVTVAASPLNSSGSATISETGPTGVFTLVRSDTSGTLSVNYTVTGTATSGVDYTLSPSTAFFGVGVSTITINVNPIHDNNPDGTPNVEQPETVKLRITASSANPPTYVAGANSAATITITDADGGNTPVTPPGSGGGSSPTPPTGDSGGDSGGNGGESGSPATGTGLTLKYYNNQDLVGNPVYTTTATSIGIADTTGSPAGTTGVNATHYSAVWTGEIQPAVSGIYTFTINVDDDAAVRLFIDDGSDDDTAQIDLRPNHKMADANDDAVVNSSDFAIIAAHFGQTGTFWDTGDFNGDGVTNALDFNALATNYGTKDTRDAKSHPLTGTVSLEAGAGYDMRLEYSQKVGDSMLTFDWTPPGAKTASEPPTSRLYPGHGAGAISVFAPDMSDSAQASALPEAVAGSTGSLFSSTQITNDKDVLG